MAVEMQHRGPAWASLGVRARAWRLLHAAWSVAQLAALANIWWAALTRRRGPRLRASVGFLLVEGAGLVVGRGNCPAGAIQARWGDPVPFFELVLPPRAAKAAVPILAVISVAGLTLLALRPPEGARAPADRPLSRRRDRIAAWRDQGGSCRSMAAASVA
jgi:hypothetical protein